MARFKVFVDTGINGGIIAIREREDPLSFFRFKRDKLGVGIRLDPFLTYCQSLRQPGGTEVFIEDPAKVPRSLTTVSTQYIVVGQITAICETVFKQRPFMISSNQWIHYVRRQLNRPDLKDPKDRSRLFATQKYPKFIAENFKGKKAPDGITDCLGMAQWLEYDEAETWSSL